MSSRDNYYFQFFLWQLKCNDNTAGSFLTVAFFLPESLQGIPCVIDYNMFKKKYFGILFIFLAIITLLLLSYYKEQGITIQPSYQTSSMQDLHLTHREDDKIKWELLAKEATFSKGEKEIFLKSLGLKINQAPEIYLTSGNGVYETEKGNISLVESVEINIKNTKFMTNTLKWDSKSELLTTEDTVKFSGKNFLIEGTGLAASVKQQKIRILKNVKATFNLT
jgi:LPS export ABC transporter protein LptC